jgi:hypothetical protein
VGFRHFAKSQLLQYSESCMNLIVPIPSQTFKVQFGAKAEFESIGALGKQKTNLFQKAENGRICVYGIKTADWCLQSANNKALARLKLPPENDDKTIYNIQSGIIKIVNGQARIHLPIIQNCEIIANVFNC